MLINEGNLVQYLPPHSQASSSNVKFLQYSLTRSAFLKSISVLFPYLPSCSLLGKYFYNPNKEYKSGELIENFDELLKYSPLVKSFIDIIEDV